MSTLMCSPVTYPSLDTGLSRRPANWQTGAWGWAYCMSGWPRGLAISCILSQSTTMLYRYKLYFISYKWSNDNYDLINFAVHSGDVFPAAFSFSLLLFTFYRISSRFLRGFERPFHLPEQNCPQARPANNVIFPFLNNLQRFRITPKLELWALRSLLRSISDKREEEKILAATIQGLHETSQPEPSSKLRKLWEQEFSRG